jgi:hypothetical protein
MLGKQLFFPLRSLPILSFCHGRDREEHEENRISDDLHVAMNMDAADYVWRPPLTHDVVTAQRPSQGGPAICESTRLGERGLSRTWGDGVDVSELIQDVEMEQADASVRNVPQSRLPSPVLPD